MKCGACGYEKKVDIRELAEVVRHKSGKKKGQIREVLEYTVDLYKDDPEFIMIELQHATFVVAGQSRREVDTLYVCPKCGTVRVELGD